MLHGLWSGWAELAAVLTTSPEEGEAAPGLVGGTQLVLLHPAECRLQKSSRGHPERLHVDSGV